VAKSINRKTRKDFRDSIVDERRWPREERSVPSPCLLIYPRCCSLDEPFTTPLQVVQWMLSGRIAIIIATWTVIARLNLYNEKKKTPPCNKTE
jgi:hypothetical protein